MGTYNVNPAKREKALRQITKKEVKSAKGFPKFCYGLTIALRVLACVLGLANILYVIFLSNYAVDIVFLIITFGFPYLLSFISAAVYAGSCSGEYRLRRRETITLANGGFVYSYHNDLMGLGDNIISLNVLYDKVKRFEYDEKTRCITLYGCILLDIYENGGLISSDELGEISLLNIFEIDVADLMVKNC